MVLNGMEAEEVDVSVAIVFDHKFQTYVKHVSTTGFFGSFSLHVSDWTFCSSGSSIMVKGELVSKLVIFNT